VVAALVAIPALCCFSLVATVGARGRASAGLARAFCAEHPVGSAADMAQLERDARARNLNVFVRAGPSGRHRLEASAGVLTAVHTCAIELSEGRVATSQTRSED
jgi:hypothetical protein